MSEVGRRLQGWREHCGLSQREAATRAGVSQSFWSQCEAGERVPSDAIAIEKLVRLTKSEPRFALSLEMFARELAARRRKRRAKTHARAA